MYLDKSEPITRAFEQVQALYPDSGNPLRLWRSDDPESTVDLFMLFMTLLAADRMPDYPLPAGVEKAKQLFNWEAHRQSDGWSQFRDARDNEIVRIRNDYVSVRLDHEAAAISGARLAYIDNDSLDAARDACEECGHEYSDSDKRLTYLAIWFCGNADSVFKETQPVAAAAQSGPSVFTSRAAIK